jgi:hypothetical protein
MVRTLDLDGNSIELARTVLKDLGLTSQMLRASNSAFYNRSGRPIMSVAHALILLGWDKVRSLVSTIRYIEHFSGRSPGLRELMLLSVLSAVESREIAIAVGYPRPEEAYICGLFKNIGEVLLACHYPREYSQIVLAIHTEKIPVRAACLRVLDFSWDDVAARVAAGWNMPSKVQQSLNGPGAAARSASAACLASVVDYSRDLTRALYRDGAGLDSVHLRTVADAEGKQVLVSVRDLRRIVDSAVNETSQTFSTLGVPANSLRLEHQAERARFILESISVFEPAALKALEQAVESAKRTIRAPDFELSAFIAAVLDAVRTAGFDNVVFGLVNEDHRAIRGRLAGSDCVDELLGRFQFPIGRSEGPVMAALDRRNDLLVDRSREGRYDQSDLVNALAPALFALFPIVIDGKSAGCLYADRRTPSPGLETVRYSLARARDAIAAALRTVAPRPKA